MAELEKMMGELERAGMHPTTTIAETMGKTGKKAVGCFPLYTPEEVVYAAGFLPVGMWGGPETGSLSDMYLQSFCCSVMKANMQQALSGRYDFLTAVITTAYCDTLKCMMENWKAASPHMNIVPVVYPQNRKSESGKMFMEEETMRLRDQLEELAGEAVTEEKLEEAVDLYEEYRTAMRAFTDAVSKVPVTVPAVKRHRILKAGWFMDKKEYTKKIEALTEELKKLPEETPEGKRVILTGVMCEPDEILEIINENGMYVVADDLAHESRQFENSCPEEGRAARRIAERLAAQDGCTFLYDEEKTRGLNLMKKVWKYRADGIIFCQMKFCDPDEFDYPILKKEMERAGVPMLHMEIEQQMQSMGQIRTRLQGFREMLP